MHLQCSIVHQRENVLTVVVVPSAHFSGALGGQSALCCTAAVTRVPLKKISSFLETKSHMLRCGPTLRETFICLSPLSDC